MEMEGDMDRFGVDGCLGVGGDIDRDGGLDDSARRLSHSSCIEGLTVNSASTRDWMNTWRVGKTG